MKKFFDLYYWFILSDAVLLALPCLLRWQEVGKARSRQQSDAKGFFEKQIDASAPWCREEKKSKWIIKDSISNVTVIDKSISLFFKKTWKTKKNNILKF